jgi:hypothetical protein
MTLCASVTVMAKKLTRVGKVLMRALDTHEARIKTYGNGGHIQYGAVMTVLFPKGLRLRTADEFARFHVFNMIVGKLCRYGRNYATGGHADSIHDLGVYSFILEDYDKHRNHGNRARDRQQPGRTRGNNRSRSRRRTL